MREADWAMLLAAKEKIADDDGLRLSAAAEAMVRGLPVAFIIFESRDLRFDYERICREPKTILISLHVSQGEGPVTGVDAETRARTEDRRRQNRGGATGHTP